MASAMMLAAAVGCSPTAATSDSGKARTEAWLANQNNNGISANVVDPDTGFVPYCRSQKSPDCKADGTDSSFHYSGIAGQVSIGFTAPISPTTPLETVRKSLNFIALDRLVLPGLHVPGWQVTPRTPMSSFREGVTIEDFREGKIKIRVQTRFFAIGGRKMTAACEPVPDEALPPTCFFEVRRDLPGTVTIELPLFAKPKG